MCPERAAGAPSCWQRSAVTRLDAAQYQGSAMVLLRSRNLLPRDGEAVLMEEAISQTDADRLFARLMDTIDWRSETALVMGRRIALPRLTAWYGEAAYSYSGIRNDPAPWTDDLLEIKAIAERCAGSSFNSVLANLYRDGRDSVSWHADDEPA